MQDRTVVITGATSGIGRAAAKALAARGAHVVMVARNPDKAADLAPVLAERGGSSDTVIADLSLLREVDAAAETIRERYDRVDRLINNAGAIFLGREETDEGLERTWALDHLAYFHLTRRLLDRLQAAAPARVVNVASGAHRGSRIHWDDPGLAQGFSTWKAYGQAKLANVLFTRELARRLQGTGVTSNAVHPGFVGSGFATNNGWFAEAVMCLLRPFARSNEKGAETVVWAATAPALEEASGLYLHDRAERTPSARARDADAAQRLWRLSAAQVDAVLGSEE